MKPSEHLTTPLVAVVTPVYNGARYLAQTMDCVQAQTYSNLVHVVLDNASTDATADIIRAYQGGRVPVAAHRNTSVLRQVDNWNAAVARTPPEACYFRLLCADDLMAPSAIEQMVALAQTDPSIGLVGCLQGVGGTQGSPARIDGGGLPDEMQVFDGRWLVKTYLMRLHGALSPTHMLIRRRYLDEEPQFYAADQVSFDVDVCLRLLLRCKYGFIHDVIGWTRLHDESMTAILAAPNQTYIAEWLDWINRHGARIMTPLELKHCQRAHLRHYFRRLLLWRFRDRNQALLARHLAILHRHGVEPTLRTYCEALLDWFWLAARRQRHRVGEASSMRARAWAELQGM